jgi:hypothetical protein
MWVMLVSISERGISNDRETRHIIGRGTHDWACAQSLAQHNDDAEMLAEAKEYENRAMDAIRQHLPELPPLEAARRGSTSFPDGTLRFRLWAA